MSPRHVPPVDSWFSPSPELPARPSRVIQHESSWVPRPPDELSASADIQPPGVDSIPPQVQAASQFAVNDSGYIDVIPDAPDPAVLANETQRELYAEIQHKAQELSALGHNQLAELSDPIRRFQAALPERIEAVSIARLWSRGNTLRSRLKAHETAIASIEAVDPARLPPLVAEMLSDLVDTYNIFIVSDPKGRELDQVRIGPQEREADQAIANALLPIVEAVRDSGVATQVAIEVLTEQLEAAQDAPSGIDGDQAIVLSRRTGTNFVTEILRIAYVPIRKLITEAGLAWKEIRSGAYRTIGGLAVTSPAFLYGEQILRFVVENASNLKVFVERAFHNPTLLRIIDIIVDSMRTP
jgi:hypothetical protein